MTRQAHSGLLRKLLGPAMMRIAGTVVSFLIVLLLAKGSETDGLAAYHLLTTLAGFWLIASKFGLDTISLRLAARQESAVAKILVIRDSLRAACLPIAVLLPVLVIYLAVFEPMTGADLLTVALIAISLVAFTFLVIAIEFYRASERQSIHSCIRFFLPNLAILALIYASMTVLPSGWSHWLIAYSPVIGRLMIAVLGGAIIGYIFLRHSRTARAKGEIHAKPEKMLWDYVPVGIATTLVVALGFIAVKSIAVFGGETDVAAHAVIIRITYGLTVLTSTVSSLVSPRMSRFNEDKEALWSLFRFSSRLMLLVGGLFMALIILFGSWFLGIFNSVFTQYYPELIVFSLAAVVNGIPFGQFMVQLDLEKPFVRIMIVAVVLQLLGCAIFGTVWGMLGIGIVAVFVAGFWNLSCFITIKKYGKL
ncbi:hypothetical protein [Celeribacter sp.]|uniref:hypothetical protein n=1 Tax=Celeribacter sp. TaxID=1890673 RepID=UPI003A951D04